MRIRYSVQTHELHRVDTFLEAVAILSAYLQPHNEDPDFQRAPASITRYTVLAGDEQPPERSPVQIKNHAVVNRFRRVTRHNMRGK